MTGGDGSVIGALTVPPVSEIVVSHAFEVLAVRERERRADRATARDLQLHRTGAGGAGERAVGARRCTGCSTP